MQLQIEEVIVKTIDRLFVTMAAGLFLLTCFAFAGPGDGRGANTDSRMTATPGTNVPGKTILFFMNPNGRPCQMQKAILDHLADSLKGLAAVTYIKTTDPEDQNKFESWGIRGLPSLIIVNKDGKELRRFPPGIQDASTVLSGLREKDK